MEIKAIIVEDEQDNIDILTHFVKKYCQKVSIVGVATSVKSAKELVKNNEVQLIFLDIMLAEGTGFDLLEGISTNNVQIIFITAYNEFAINAFRYSAVDYLLKPLQIEELVTAVDKALIRIQYDSTKNQLEILKNKLNLNLSSEKDEFIAIPMVDKIEFIEVENILYIVADGTYSTFVLNEGKSVVSSKNIGEYEKTLMDNNQFFRVHNTYIVNLRFINSIGKIDGLFCDMCNGEQIPISRRRKDKLFIRLKLK